MTVTITEGLPGTSTLTNKNLIPDRLWTLLVDRIVTDWKMSPALAERIMDQALAFLRLTAEDTTGATFSPSALVDVGWHIFILHTRAYTAFCHDLAGHYIHHTPYSEREVNIAAADCGPCGPCHTHEHGIDSDTNNIRRTVEAMKALCIVVDEALWATTSEVRAATLAFALTDRDE